MLVSKLRQKLSSQFIRNISWLGGAELANRIFRLGTTFTLARMFSAHDYGLVAIVFTTYDFASIFTLKYGIGSKIVQANNQDLEIICNTSYWLNWILCGTFFIIQCIAAFPVAWFYKDSQVILPICAIALIYLTMPIFLVQSALIERENRLKITALCNIVQSLIANVMTISLALIGIGVWAVVLPVILVTPLVWIPIVYTNHPWRSPKYFSLNRSKEIINFGKDLLGVSLLSKIRGNIDYLLIGHFIGVDALGIYYFAFNAGLGISQNVINVFTSALFPHLCAVRGNFKQLKDRYFSSLKTTAIFVVPLILLQSSLAPLYVPIVFGHKWVAAIPILILICLSALPTPFSSATYLLLKAVGTTHIILYWDVIYTVIFSISLLAAVRGGIFWVATAVLVCQLLSQPIFTIWASRYAFSRNYGS